MTTRKVYIKCFGCQMNKLDSSLVAAALRAAGFEMTDKATDADAVVINTCSVREHAEARVFSHLGHLKHMKKSRPGLVVAVMGCMAQRLGESLLAHEAVNIVVGPHQIPQMPDMLTAALETNGPAVRIAVTQHIRTPDDAAAAEHLDAFETAYDSDENHIKSQAFVRIMRGCNNFCSYCVVPYVRGPEVSRPPRAIMEQIRKLADQGIQQVTLLGQTVNSYAYSAGERTYKLADLLEMASEIEGIHWLRFVTSHPGAFDNSILNAMARLPKVCPYLHIPAQSGSDSILAAMNRRYTAQHYLDLLAKARAIVPDIAIAGDFIVGFPGETDEDFEATAALVRAACYKNIFVFKYSPRPGTRAEQKLADSVPSEIKQQRNHALLALQNEIAADYNSRFLGRELEVLVEGLSKKPHLNNAQEAGHPQLVGRTATDYIVVFNGPESLTGRFARIRIDQTSALTLFGRPV
ncbi:MAG: tRNA (N6-isopentenyl adenosine(37)-C2)-methylthiotransferase MiaB [Phycisphaerae bacterium]|nr:tRNA (N6-isopentenyl adenosine(37)-C2)-methylthiotransferase MiaB [Phycisphaerae bacterium]